MKLSRHTGDCHARAVSLMHLLIKTSSWRLSTQRKEAHIRKMKSVFLTSALCAVIVTHDVQSVEANLSPVSDL